MLDKLSSIKATPIKSRSRHRKQNTELYGSINQNDIDDDSILKKKKKNFSSLYRNSENTD
eukprot:CAMPEP_0116884920 /NCGR_PEP_ID=MMETSP0463-20121206/18027_1 /TAXON_ID=181622 /ORGANISM="Strombidinopsis sp, Strain SopsisLIS2011" /LENGTH=59 /DNA_ID=CAMNT_0004542337 /DNA_START=103 /DNA_END=282 /DNA_ORIENTATION=-